MRNSSGFFNDRGLIDSGIIKSIRKLCLELSKYYTTSVEYFMDESLESLIEIKEEAERGENA